MKTTKFTTRKLVMLALLTAIVAVLQAVANYVTFGPVSITLALAPIVIGSAIYGIGTGAWLGFVFSVLVLTAPSTAAFLEYNAFATVILVLLKGTCAGLAAGFVYKLTERKNKFLAALLSGIAAPIVNTGIFTIGSFTIFLPFFKGIDANVVPFIFFAVIGTNFLIEFGVNIVLSSVITRIITLSTKMARITGSAEKAKQ